MKSTEKKGRMGLLLLLLLVWCGCRSEKTESRELLQAAATEDGKESKTIALVLSSMDGAENEAITEAFTEAARAAGAELVVKIPEITAQMAEEARALTGDFVLMDQDPIELQMLIINELVLENVDVIAIDANHTDALEPVLGAAQKAGIRVCAFGQPVNERCCEVYVETKDAPDAAVRLLTGAEEKEP